MINSEKLINAQKCAYADVVIWKLISKFFFLFTSYPGISVFFPRSKIWALLKHIQVLLTEHGLQISYKVQKSVCVTESLMRCCNYAILYYPVEYFVLLALFSWYPGDSKYQR